MKRYFKIIGICLCMIIFGIFVYKIVNDDVIFIDSFYDCISISDGITSILKVITNLSSVIFIVIATIGAIIFVKNKSFKILIFSNVIGITIINNLLKVIIARDRPNINRLVDESGYSFPSGHSATSMVFYGYLIYLIFKYVPDNRKRIPLIIFLSLLILTIGFSRIYLGVHYTSDVVGGFLLGFVYLVIFVSITKKFELDFTK